MIFGVPTVGSDHKQVTEHVTERAAEHGAENVEYDDVEEMVDTEKYHENINNSWTKCPTKLIFNFLESTELAEDNAE